jgi:tRNA G10  N-methylase Trm11
MERYLFVLGSNWQLSLAELDNCLKYSQFKGKIVDYSANIAIVEFEDLHKEKHYINKLMEFQFLLGGCQKIAEIYDFIHIQTVITAFPSHMEKYKLVSKLREKILNVIDKNLEKIFRRIKNESLFFAISIYPNLFDDEYYSKVLVKHFLPFLNKELMILLKQKGAKKSLYYQYPEKNIRAGNLNPIFPHHLIKYGLFNEDRAEIIFGFTEEGVYLARTYTCDDPNFKKRIDEERPHKEFKSAISPKLAIMMLNFLNLFEERDNIKIMDPFVGNGTIPLFAILQDFEIYGADIEENKVSNTIRNIQWLLEELEEPPAVLLDKRIIVSNIENLSQNFHNEVFDGICTEPSLGPFFKEKPYYTQVKELIENRLEPLYEATFREASKLLRSRGRICISAPIISTIDGKDVQLNVELFARKYNFVLIPMIDERRIINKSNQKLQFQKKHLRTLIDAKKGQIIKRKIYVFEKKED